VSAFSVLLLGAVEAGYVLARLALARIIVATVSTK
jgi:hypothetical protein